MGKLTFILGGARSGKSSYAQRFAERSDKSVTLIATAQPLDDEMASRIQRHREERSVEWTTLEIPLDVVSHLPEIKTGLVILDCMTLLVTNLLMQFVKNDLVDETLFMQAVQKEVNALLAGIHESKQDWLIISNEVGLGLVPPYQMGRAYRDALGWANQRIASIADDVLWMVAGIPVPIQGFRES
jgi:adenosylcobinamide kinase / adenosylcobinamide-phosphate guanylyltransferase